MRVNLENIINRNINISKLSQVKVNNLIKGEIIKGDIQDVKLNNILIKLADGTNLMAKLTMDNMEFSIGQKMSFQVKDANTEQILLKPVINEDYNPKSNKLLQVLDEASVVANEKNIEIVSKLLDNNMPIDKDFINNIIKLTNKFKDTSIDKLITLVKNNIPVTQENIEQLNNYEQGNNSMKQEIISLANRMIDNNDTDYKQQLIQILGNQKNVHQSTGNSENVITQEIASEISGKNIDNNINNSINNNINKNVNNNLTVLDIMPEDNLKELQKEINSTYKLEGNNTLKLSKELTLQDLKQQILTLDINEEDKVNINKTITNKLLDFLVDKNVFLDPKALEDTKLLKEYFNNIYEKVINIIKFTSTTVEGKNNDVVKDATKVKNNIEFMNSLNNNYNYVQLPFKFNKLLNSELYIFENKKELRKKSKSDAVSALLRLDYVNLGHMDVYISKQVKNVECKFYVEDEQKKNIINEHINKLYKRIKSFDYNITGLMVIDNKKDFNFVEDFVSRKEEAKAVKRYSFDMRV
jgi:hypothetical protein